MEIVQDESISTTSIAGAKFHDKPMHRMDHRHAVEPSMSSLLIQVESSGSNVSVEAHPSSTSNRSVLSSWDQRDSRHDSPKTGDEDDAIMESDDNGTESQGGFVIPVPVVPSSLSSRMRIVTNESRSHNRSSSTPEEKVSLAPRVGRPEDVRPNETVEQGAEEEAGDALQDNSSLFSLSGSMSSEFLEHQQNHPDHQQEYLRHPNRTAFGMHSPTSTTARDFLREIQCPPLPIHNVDREARITASTPANIGTRSLPLHPRGHLNQRPPFHPPLATSHATTPSSSNLSAHTSSTPPISSFTHLNTTSISSRREHTQASPSPTNTIPGLDGFSCDNSSTDGGRDKPTISRCFAWSQDSQDDRRITKRARTTHPDGHGHSPLSADTLSVMSPSSAAAAVSSARQQFQPIRNPGDESPPCSTPTKVHWEEKVDNSNGWVAKSVDVNPQVLFGTTTEANKNTDDNNGDVDMCDGPEQPATVGESMHPPIATAHSASHYSFESM